MKRLATLLFFAGIALAVSSCCSCRKAKSIPMVGTSWELIEIGGSVVARAKVEAESYRLMLGQDGRYSGKANCNNYNGTYSLDENKGSAKFNMPSTTRMLCPDMEGERAYLEMIGKVSNFKIDGDILTLSDSESGVLAVYKRVN